MNNWFTTVNNAGFPVVAKRFQLESGRMSSFGPCPSCKATRRGSNDSRGPIGITPNKKGFKCFSCGIHGDVADFISLYLTEKKCRDVSKVDYKKINKWLRDNDFESSGASAKDSLVPISKFGKTSEKKQHVDTTSDFRWHKDLPLKYKENLYSDEGRAVYSYLTEERKLEPDVIDGADLGCMWIERANGKEYWLSIPLKNEDGEIVNMRFRSIPPNQKSYRVCAGRPLPLYGVETLTDDKQQVLVVEGELDVLALKTYGFTTNVVSGTSGASANWRDEWLDALEAFPQFLIWYDNDAAGDNGADKLAKRLGEYRSFRIRSEFNDVGEALQHDVDGDQIEDILHDNSEPFLKSKLKTVDAYADEIENLIKNPHILQGIPLGSHKLDRVLGGLMPGLWVVTGDTGHGKTTWCTWLLMLQAQRGTPVMLTSFEQRPIGTVQKLLRATVGGDFTKVSEDERRQAFREMGKLPMYIFDHYGELNFELLRDTIRFAARRFDMKVALIDHLGFLTQPKEKGDDERILIEKVVRSLATIAVQDGITIILVCHPNNLSVAQQRRVKISDLKGASAIRQDAHVALVVERQPMIPERGFPCAAIYVDKVRSEFGSSGAKVIMPFDPLSCVYGDSREDTPSGKKGRKVIVPEQQFEEKRKSKKRSK